MSNTVDGAGYTVNKVANETAAQNVNFIDGDTPWSYDISASPDETAQLAGFSDAELGSFLSRPLKIQEFQWTPGGQLFQVFNPWSDFFGNADVLDKINRYRNLRCNLRMKVLVNGNSFYYGRALLSYNPYLEDDNVTKNRAFFIQDLVQASQKPHLLLDPCTSQGGEMLLPFIWPENYLDITNANWEDEMGRVTIHDFDVLHHANGGTDPISVVVFVWAENVTLAVPTTTAAQGAVTAADLDEFGFPKPYDTQASGKKPKKSIRKANNTQSSTEWEPDGVISKPASAIAKAANALSMIPVIGPYAKSTEMVATRIGQVARLFGYSRPQIMTDASVYTPRYAGNICNSDKPETLVKLTLDSKNELSIDSRVMGLGGEDELTINSIAQRPSFWRQFNWPETAVTDTLLTSFQVMPIYGQVLTAAPVEELHATALAFAATPFEAWQGSIKFRFNVVCSEYHRGRLRIVYNPKTSPAGAIPYNQVYSTIIDIKEERDFEYEVKWADIRAWGRNLGVRALTSTTLFSDSTPVTTGTEFDNGSLSVYVVNELATPSTSAADVDIQIWVSAGDDFAVAAPSPNNYSQLSVFAEQAEMAPDTLATTTDDSNAPTCVGEIKSFGMGEGIKEDNQYLVYQGERILSFREMLKRYYYHNSYFPCDIGTYAADRIVQFTMHDFPFYRGWETTAAQDSATDSVAGTSPYNFVGNTLINYLTPAFVCRRGGMRHKTLYVQTDGATRLPNLTVARQGVNGAANGATSFDMSGVTGNRRAEICDSEINSTGGTQVTPVFQNPVLEYETGFYTFGQRFLPARKTLRYSDAEMAHSVCLDMQGSGDVLAHRLDKYVSTAEDFQLALYVGAPILYNYIDPTAVS
jgi:hypothetical protein